jgi:hypothetical protein
MGPDDEPTVSLNRSRSAFLSSRTGDEIAALRPLRAQEGPGRRRKRPKRFLRPRPC